MSETPTAVDVARVLADTLEERGLPYAIGGALALGFYAVPRATVDVDINIFLEPDGGMARILAALDAAGFVADDEQETLTSRARSEGQFRGRISGLRVDVFVPAIPYYASMLGRRRETVLLGRPAWVIGPEDLVVLKLMFFRRKDLADVEAVMRDQGRLDRSFVRNTLIELVGAGDERVLALTQIERDVDAEPH